VVEIRLVEAEPDPGIPAPTYPPRPYRPAEG
jgi:hypothetical protein